VRWFRFLYVLFPWLLLLVLAVEFYPSRIENRRLSSAVTRLDAELMQVRREQVMPASVLQRHRNAICYVYAVYTMEWPAKWAHRKIEKHTRVSGTGFLVADDLIATNRHVVEPWFEDNDDEDQIKAGAKPKLEKLVAFFPGLSASLRLDDVRVSPDHDLAIARLADEPLPNNIEPLPLATQDPNPGDQVIVVGYPLGISTMLAKTPNNLYKRLASSKDTIQVATELAANRLIRPSATCGHLGDIVNEKLIYDAPTAQGGSGGPVFNSNGEVIGVNAAYIEGFSGGTIGISAGALRPLLDAASRHAR
jgi:serine protease Do